MIVAGFGAAARADVRSFRALMSHAPEGAAVDALATVAGKCQALQAMAQELGLPLITLSPAQIAGALTPTQSSRSLAAFGTGSVAEACALVAAGAGAQLLVARVTSPDRLATCAFARGSTT